MSNANHDRSLHSRYPDRSKRPVFDTVFHWLFGRLGGNDQNVETIEKQCRYLDGQSKYPTGAD